MKKTNLLLAFLIFPFAVNLFAQSGVIDNSFGNGGIVTTAMGNGNGQGWSMAVQDDWSIVVGGFQTNGNGTDSDFAIIRYLPNGAIDNSFGINGKVITPMGPGDDVIYSIALQPDGKIVAAGLAWNGTDYDFAMARYSTSGVLDSSFGINGKVVQPVGPANDIAVSVTIQYDWAVVLGGTTFSGTDKDFAVLRFTPSGVLDNTFGINGKVITPIGIGDDELCGIAIQPDSSIVAAGTIYSGTGSNFGLARYLKNGTLDNSFGISGKVISTSVLNDDKATTMLLGNNGKILVGGYSGNGLTDDFCVSSYDPDGSPDNGFGNNGKSKTSFGDSSSTIYALAIQPNGKIIAMGSAVNAAGKEEFAMARYKVNGNLDNNFANNGLLSTPVSAGNSEAYAISLQPDGKIITAGYANNGTNDEFSVVRYLNDISVGVLDFSLPDNSIIVYPNPVAKNVFLQYTLTKDEPVSVTLMDMEGRLVKTFIEKQHQPEGEHKLPLLLPESLAQGSYVINISTPSVKMSIKIVK